MDGKRMIEDGIKYLVIKVEENTNMVTLFKPMNWDGPVVRELHPAIHIATDEAMILNENDKRAIGLIEIIDYVWHEEKEKCL